MNTIKKPVYILVFILLITLLFPASVPAQESITDEVRYLLENYYVDPVASEILSAASVEEILTRLNDPNTTYFSPEEYQDFVNSINMKFCGIGVQIDAVPEGILIISVFEGSPAKEAGLHPEDIITEAGGHSLAGLSTNEAASIIRGPEGTDVKLVIKRGQSTFDVVATRREIQAPTATGKILKNHIGYIAISSFGTDTSAAVEALINNLKGQNADGWVIDLRNNPGGYVDTALNIAGFFLNDNIAMQVKGQDNITYLYKAYRHDFTFNQPVVLLINGYSASASEIVAAAVKDYQKVTLTGALTYGKGTMQRTYMLSNGGALKMTVARFYSPNGATIDKTGVTPEIAIQKADSLRAAELLFSGAQDTGGAGGYAQVSSLPNTFRVSLSQARTAAYWAAWGEILNTFSAPGALSGLKIYNGPDEREVTAPELEARWPLYYPDHHLTGELPDTGEDKQFTVRFNQAVDWHTVNSDSVELVEGATGERVELGFCPLDDTSVKIAPAAAMKQGATYWLLIHDAVKNTAGKSLKAGTLAVVKTGGGVAALPGTGPKDAKGIKQAPEKDTGYGWLIMGN